MKLRPGPAINPGLAKCSSRVMVRIFPLSCDMPLVISRLPCATTDPRSTRLVHSRTAKRKRFLPAIVLPISQPCHTETRSRTCGLAAGEPPPTCVPT
jgi:hypothetical protein